MSIVENDISRDQKTTSSTFPNRQRPHRLVDLRLSVFYTVLRHKLNENVIYTISLLNVSTLPGSFAYLLIFGCH